MAVVRSDGSVDIDTQAEYFSEEHYRYLQNILKDALDPHLLNYVKGANFTPRALSKLTVYVKNLLDPEYAITKLESGRQGLDFQFLRDKIQILKCELPLGLTKFDMTPEFIFIIDSLDAKWLAKTYRSKGGFERIRQQTDRHEVVRPNTPEEEEEKESNKKRLFGLLRG